MKINEIINEAFGDLDSLPPLKKPNKDDPYEQGWSAFYRRGDESDNPYERGTQEYKQWNDGFQDGEAEPNHYDESVDLDEVLSYDDIPAAIRKQRGDAPLTVNQVRGQDRGDSQTRLSSQSSSYDARAERARSSLSPHDRERQRNADLNAAAYANIDEGDKFESSMTAAAKNPSGPKFGGYYGATQKGAPKPGQGFGAAESVGAKISIKGKK